MKKSIKNIRKYFVRAGLVLLAIVFVASSVLRDTKNTSATSAGPGEYDTGACTSGNCYSIRKNGAFWVKIPVSSNGVSVASLGFTMVFDSATVNCWTGDPATSFVYVLATPLSGGGLAGMVNLDEVVKRGNGVKDKGYVPAGMNGTVETEAGARNQFNENADTYLKDFGQVYDGPSHSGTGLAYFCYTPKPESSKDKKTSPPDSTRKLNCGAYGSDPKADTQSRIAVQNMSLDGAYNPTDASGNPVRWKANGSRSGITSDSMYSQGSASVYTLAKPGDSIRFYHGVCMAVRYGKWTPTQGSWTSQESHSKEYTPLPNNWMNIYADPENYVFEKVSVWNNFANQVKNVSSHKNLFSSAGAGSLVNTLRDAIDIINPTPGNTQYTCNEISWYASRDPFIAGGYHIPGFKNGSCSSASMTGISQATGTTISQWHEYNSLRMWEIRSHSISGSCGCGSNDATLIGNYQAATYDAAWQGGILGNRKEYYCKDASKTTKDCAWSCDVMGEYGCIKGSYKKVQYHYSDHSFDFMYNSTHYEEYASKWATVYVPYNYKTKVKSDIDAYDVTFQGAAISTSYTWKVLPRENDKTAPGWSGYATSTPDTGRPNETHVVMFEWLYYPGDHNVAGEEFSKKGPKQYYSAGMVPGSYQVIEDQDWDQNPTGNYKGASHAAAHVRTVPDNDEYIGYKYCTAIAFYPSDSHNNKSNTLERQKTSGENGAMDAGERWNISGASCRTIAKKPNVQVWNGSLYTEGSIYTSITRKWTNSKMRQQDYDGSKTDIFGSWTDYAIVAGRENKLMASGANLGYDNSKYDLRGYKGKDYDVASPQKLNPETIANDSKPTGHSTVNTSVSYTQNLDRLYSRYKDKVPTLLSEIGHNGTGKYIYTTKTGMQAANVGSSTMKLSDLIKDPSSSSSSNPNFGTLSKAANTDLVKRLGDGKNDNTLVIVSSGTFVIDRNICYGDSCGDDATKLWTYKSGTLTNKAAALPQVLIFAKNIEIAENVTRVDAWLVAPEGTLNTCANHKIGKSSATKTGLIARDASDYHYTNGNCGLTLVVNGPVFAHHINLLRTAGAFHGWADMNAAPDNDVRKRSIGATGKADDKNKGSNAPAEIFNLRSDVYIWAYNQAERYSEAVVTYTRELAPRY